MLECEIMVGYDYDRFVAFPLTSLKTEDRMKRLVVFCLALVFLVGPVVTAYSQTPQSQMYYAGSQGPSDWDIVVDVTLARPLGLIGTAAGLGLGILALPFTLPSGTTGSVFQKLVAEPFDYTFRRPVGYYGPPIAPTTDLGQQP